MPGIAVGLGVGVPFTRRVLPSTEQPEVQDSAENSIPDQGSADRFDRAADGPVGHGA